MSDRTGGPGLGLSGSRDRSHPSRAPRLASGPAAQAIHISVACRAGCCHAAHARHLTGGQLQACRHCRCRLLRQVLPAGRQEIDRPDSFWPILSPWRPPGVRVPSCLGSGLGRGQKTHHALAFVLCERRQGIDPMTA